MTRHAILLSALVGLSLGAAAMPAAAQNIPAYISAAVNDKSRPAVDTMRDAARKPAESIAFSTIKPGDKVADFIAGGGYFTRILAKVVGPQGRVYATAPAGGMMMGPPSGEAGPAMMGQQAGTMPPAGAMMMGGGGLQAIAADPAYSNVFVLTQPVSKLAAPEPLDVVWTAQNYHDLHNPGPFHADDIAAFNKSVFDALKPGGVFLVIDYAAAPGTGFSQSPTLHRADPEAEKAEILKAGFVFDGESKVLNRPNDPHTMRSHEQDDQFIFRFRKPR